MVVDDNFTADVRVPSSRYDREIERGVDLISSLPDEIIQHILAFVPTKEAITTSLLSKRWRYMASSLNKIQNIYTAIKMIDLNIRTGMIHHIPQLNSWIELAMSRNVETMSLAMMDANLEKYDIPEFFYTNTSVKQLSFEFYFADMIPKRSVSWTSLKKLKLSCCRLSDESLAKLLSGCPVLENPMLIVAPHIHRLVLRNSQFPCTLVDVSSLIEARVNYRFDLYKRTLEDDLLHLMMLEKLQNVEKLTIGADLLHVLSLGELRGNRFPMFKVKALTIETTMFQFVIPPAIERLLQNSPDLKKLTIHTRTYDTALGEKINSQLDQCLQSKDSIFQNMSCWDKESQQVASFVEPLVKEAKRLEKMIIHLEDRYLKARGFQNLVHTLSHNKDVSNIVLSTEPTRSDKCGIIGLFQMS
ncbi:putative F-box/LRR-repeat protein At3g18150 [Capsella rubella]|uniref:putative F-box/LRR-repeat protein At3g18150 n=1 Tax=Capsella rubella TaxID=81985 RepID=UPI000CD53C76|nr:putative F-box/LRR-repeat protein At3g18150 [Capsella rubella]